MYFGPKVNITKGIGCGVENKFEVHICIQNVCVFLYNFFGLYICFCIIYHKEELITSFKRVKCKSN